MEENNKVIIFEKKEIIIILIFVVVLIITSFTLGIRLGKKLAPESVTPVAKEAPKDDGEVVFKSSDEEAVEKALSDDSKLSDDEKLKRLMDESKSRLNDQLEKFGTAPEKGTEAKPQESRATTKSEVPAQNKMSGKFTIQLGSYNSLEEAKQFAEGFSVRGYNPIINEVEIEGKGLWYRVSLGLFGTIEEAKAYIKQEQSLFSGQEHVISEIK